MASTQRPKQPTPDARGRPKSSSSRQQIQPGQQTQTGSPELDRASAKTERSQPHKPQSKRKK